MPSSSRLAERLRTLVAASILTASATAARAEITFDLAAPSPALGRAIPYTLYTPPGVPRGPLPVLYLLHGLGDDERTWARLGQIEETMDRLVAERRIAPMLVVMPAAGRSWYVDDPDPAGAGAMMQALTRDLVAHVETAHPAASCREGRAVGGLSMGGYGALLFAMDEPRRYGAAFALSGSLFRPMPEDPEERSRRVTRMFGRVFGEPLDWRRFNAWNLFPKLPPYIADERRTPFYLAVGDEDFPSLRAGVAAFREALTASGVEVAYRMDVGPHVWSLWARQLGPALEWVSANLHPACPR
jgi:S-formylglutathione hydrolase FrmB